MSEVEVRGILPQIVRNDQDLYEGDLSHYLKVIFNHAINLNNPYHNFRHMFHVLWLCHEACKFYADGLTKRDKRNLLIAAVFHDFDHLGNSSPIKSTSIALLRVYKRMWLKRM